MILDDIDASNLVVNQNEFTSRLKSIRKGNFGAFILNHEKDSASLWMHVNCELYYVYYFIDQTGSHPGFHSINNAECKSNDEVFFLQTDGVEANGFTVPMKNTISFEAALSAAYDFFRSTQLPKSIVWNEL